MMKEKNVRDCELKWWAISYRFTKILQKGGVLQWTV